MSPPIRRVAVISHTSRISGAERVIVTMFLAAGIRARVFTGNEKVATWYREAGLEAEVVPGFQPASTLGGPRGWLRFICSIFALRRQVRAFGPGYLHAMNPVALLVAVIMRLSGLRQPVVLHCHDYYERRPRSVRLVVRLTVPFVTGVLAVSADIKRSLIKFGYSPGIIEVLYNGTPIFAVAPGKKGNRILICSYFEPWKGLALALTGIAAAQQQPEPLLLDGVDVVGGFSDAEGEKQAHELAEAISCPVTFHGAVPNPRIFFDRAAILLHMPIMPDPFPTVVLEGMAAACIPVVSPLGGAKEAVADLGLVVANLTASDIGSALIQAAGLASDGITPRLVAERAEQHLSAEAVGARYLSWWSTALHSANP